MADRPRSFRELNVFSQGARGRHRNPSKVKQLRRSSERGHAAIPRLNVVGSSRGSSCGRDCEIRTVSGLELPPLIPAVACIPPCTRPNSRPNREAPLVPRGVDEVATSLLALCSVRMCSNLFLRGEPALETLAAEARQQSPENQIL